MPLFVLFDVFFVGAGAPRAPQGIPRLRFEDFFANLSCHAVAAGRDS